MRMSRLEELEKRLERLPKPGPRGVIVYTDEADLERQLAEFRDFHGEEATCILLPDNGRGGQRGDSDG